MTAALTLVAALPACWGCTNPAQPVFVNGSGWMTLCDPCAHDADAAVAGRSGVMAVYLADDDALCLFVEGGGVALTATEARQLVAAIGNALTVRAARGVAL